ncbi:hypothetical protein MML48_5g00012813 [Holotrichia oblita]|uniref:Uncharacterized protein n=1 Tax=Holotrichia oblita TaxID=644536 RepID=A0ACB9T5A0_HOLOL|nr:hypothetical protein MML48_5g00012813 [Holotrichia oblita]
MRIEDELILREHCKKEEKYFHVYDHFTPNFHRSAITGKFYSKYDALDLTKVDEDRLKQIRKHRDKGPKEKYSWPATVNQLYGWFSSVPLVDIDRNDPRLYFPLVQHPITKHGLLLKNDRSMTVEKFSGVPFKLQ